MIQSHRYLAAAVWVYQGIRVLLANKLASFLFLLSLFPLFSMTGTGNRCTCASSTRAHYTSPSRSARKIRSDKDPRYGFLPPVLQLYSNSKHRSRCLNDMVSLIHFQTTKCFTPSSQWWLHDVQISTLSAAVNAAVCRSWIFITMHFALYTWLFVISMFEKNDTNLTLQTFRIYFQEYFTK